MITVLHIITGLRRGGAEGSLLRLVTSMDCQRFRNVVISLLPPTGYWDEFAKCDVELHSLNAGGAGTAAALARLLGHVRRVKPDIVQTWLYHGDLVGATLCRAVSRAPLVWNIRNSDMKAGGRLSHKLLVRALAVLSPAVRVAVVNSRAGLDAHRRSGFRPQRWELIPNGYDLALFRPDPTARERWRAALAIAPDTLLIGMLARFDPMKAHENLLAAAAGLRSALPNARLALAGVGMEEGNTALAAMIERHEMRTRVLLLGERSDIPDLLPAFDLVVLPSAFGEGFPNAICEAMASGVPVVATDLGDVSDIVVDGGHVVPPNDIDALARAILAIARLGAEGRAALGVRGREQIESRYSLAHTISRYESLYETLSGRV